MASQIYDALRARMTKPTPSTETVTWQPLDDREGERLWFSSLAKAVTRDDGSQIRRLVTLADVISKAKAHKYIRRVPTGNPKRPWKYFYGVAGGKGVGSHDEMTVGSAHRGTHNGEVGHWIVEHDHGDEVTIRHDETGHTERVSKDEFSKRLKDEHGAEIERVTKDKQDRAKKRALTDFEAAQAHGTPKHVEAARKRAKEAGAGDLKTEKEKDEAAAKEKAAAEKKQAEEAKAKAEKEAQEAKAKAEREAAEEKARAAKEKAEREAKAKAEHQAKMEREAAEDAKKEPPGIADSLEPVAPVVPTSSDDGKSFTYSQHQPPRWLGFDPVAMGVRWYDTGGKWKEARFGDNATLRSTGLFASMDQWSLNFYAGVIGKEWNNLSQKQQDLFAEKIKPKLARWWANMNDKQRMDFCENFALPDRQEGKKPKEGPAPAPVVSALSAQEDTSFTVPKGMAKMTWKLHDYQKKAVNFATKYADGQRPLLAMEMGLGKTLTAVTAFHVLKDQGKVTQAVVTAPSSAHGSWQDHFAAVSDAKVGFVGTGLTPKKRQAVYDAFKRGEIDVIVMTPDALGNDDKEIKAMLEGKDSKQVLRIADEVHKFKNPSAKRSKAFKEILSEPEGPVIGMTGTIKPNQPKDFYHITRMVSPGALPMSLEQFGQSYCRTSWNRFKGPRGGYDIDGFEPSKMPDLHKRLGNVMMVKTTKDPDVDIALPERIDLAPRLELDTVQMHFLESINAAKDNADYIGNEKAVGKLDQPPADWRQAIARVAAKAAKNHLTAMNATLMATADPASLGEDVARLLPAGYISPKMDAISDAVSEHIGNNPERGAVIFGTYVKSLESMKQALLDKGVKPEHIYVVHGQSGSVREAEQGINSGKYRVVIGQTDMMETGANMQGRANFVSFIDTPPKPATITQAIARVHRQGQKNKTTVYRPIGSNMELAVEALVADKISETALVQGKQMESDRALVSGIANRHDLSPDAIWEALGIAPKQKGKK